MLKLLLLTLALLACNSLVLAQADTPKADIFAGYAYGSIDTGIDRISAHGAGFSVTGNLSKTFGITGEYTYGRSDLSFGSGSLKVDTNITNHLFLAGPRLHIRGDRGTAFVHALVGVARSTAGVKVVGVNVNIGDTNLALGFGGGADYNLSKRFAIRVIQADYIPVHGDGAWSHNFRVMAGVVFRIGN